MADYGSQTETANKPDDGTAPKDDAGLYIQLKDWVSSDIDHSNTWRTQARADFAFVPGGEGQWDTDAIERLRDEQRPIVTFNKTGKFIKAVCGIESNNRHSTVFIPTDVSDPGDVQENEGLSGVNDWMERGCKANKKQSRAFRDAFICGMGFTEGRIDFDLDPKGKYAEDRCAPWEMGWDRDARDDNLADAKRIWRARKMPLSSARALLPGVTDAEGVTADDLDASWAADVYSDSKGNLKTQQQKEMRAENRTGDDRREVTVLQIQWWEYESYVKTLHPALAPVLAGQPGIQRPKQQLIDVSPEQHQMLNARLGPRFPGGPNMPAGQWPGRPMRRKVYKQAFLGGRVLQSGAAPRKSGFTFNAITYEPDDIKGTWYGAISTLRDPQVWSNKFFAQVMHIVNSTAKGGIMVEKSAMDDAQEFLKNYARPNAVTVLADGAIAKGKVMAKPGAGLTAGVMSLLQIADNALQTTIGINLELLGLADRDQAGVLEAQRKQAAMTILATLFDNYSAFKQNVGMMRLDFIQNYLATDTPRMIRVLGENGYKAIPLLRKDVGGEYEVEVSEAPSSPNTKEKVWASLMQVLPAFKDMITPEVAVMILDYAPGLPSKLVESLKAIAQRPDPDAEEHKQIAKNMANAELENKQADTKLKQSQASMDLANGILAIAKAGVEQAGADVTAFNAIVDAIGAHQDRQIQVAQGVGDAITAGETPAPAQPKELPELGEMLSPPPQANPQAMPSALPGGLVPPGGLGGMPT